MDANLTNQYNIESGLQRERIEGERSLNAPYMLQNQRDTQAALLEQLNPEKLIEEMKLTLKGLRFDEITGKIEKEGEPLMNDLGIGRMVATVRSVVNQNTIMSALEERMINKIMVDFLDDIIDDLTQNWKEYNIKYKADLDRIEGICKRMALAALMRCKFGGERRFLGTTTVESISTQPRFQPQKKENFWSKFKL